MSAFTTIMEHRPNSGVVLLAGAAGSGRTTVLRHLVRAHPATDRFLAVTGTSTEWEDLPQVDAPALEGTADAAGLLVVIEEFLRQEPADAPVAVLLDLPTGQPLSAETVVETPDHWGAQQQRVAAYDHLVERLSDLARSRAGATVFYVAKELAEANPFGYNALQLADMALLVAVPAPGLTTLAVVKHRAAPPQVWGLLFDPEAGTYTVASYEELDQVAGGSRAVLEQHGWPTEQALPPRPEPAAAENEAPEQYEEAV